MDVTDARPTGRPSHAARPLVEVALQPQGPVARPRPPVVRALDPPTARALALAHDRAASRRAGQKGGRAALGRPHLLGVSLSASTECVGTSPVNAPVNSPRSFRRYKSRTVACAAGARVTPGGRAHAAGRRAESPLQPRTAAPVGRPMLFQKTVMLCAPNLLSEPTCRLKRTTARAPPSSGHAYTCARHPVLSMQPVCQGAKQGCRTCRAPHAAHCGEGMACAWGAARRARLGRPLLPDQLARDAQRVLVHGDDLARGQQPEREVVHQPARARTSGRASTGPNPVPSRPSAHPARLCRTREGGPGARRRSAPKMSGDLMIDQSAMCAVASLPVR